MPNVIDILLRSQFQSKGTVDASRELKNVEAVLRGLNSTGLVTSATLGRTTGVVQGLSAVLSRGLGPGGVIAGVIVTVASLATLFRKDVTEGADKAGASLGRAQTQASDLARVITDSLTKSFAGLNSEIDRTTKRLEFALDLRNQVAAAEAKNQIAQVKGSNLPEGERAARVAELELAEALRNARQPIERARIEAEAANQRLKLARIHEEELLNNIAIREGQLQSLSNRSALEGEFNRLITEQQNRQPPALLIGLGGSVTAEQAKANRLAEEEYFAAAKRTRERLRELKVLLGDEGDAQRTALEGTIKDFTQKLNDATTKRVEVEKSAAAAAERLAALQAAIGAGEPGTISGALASESAANAAGKSGIADTRAGKLDRANESFNLSRQIAELEREIAGIESSRFITREDKQKAIAELMMAQNRLLEDRLRLLSELSEAEDDPRLKLEIERERAGVEDDLTRNTIRTGETSPLGVGDQVGADITQIIDEWGTRSQRIAQLITGPIRAGLQGARQSLQLILGDTNFWQQKLGTIGGLIAGSLTGAIADMFTQWIAGRLKVKAVEIASASAEFIAKIPGMIATSISSFGLAAVLGLAAVAGVLAGGFEEGGYTGGTAGQPAGIVHGQEYVFSAPAVRAIGRGNLDGMHAAARTGSTDSTGGIGAGSPIINIGVFGLREQALKWVDSREGQKIIVNAAQRNRRDMGIET